MNAHGPGHLPSSLAEGPPRAGRRVLILASVDPDACLRAARGREQHRADRSRLAGRRCAPARRDDLAAPGRPAARAAQRRPAAAGGDARRPREGSANSSRRQRCSRRCSRASSSSRSTARCCSSTTSTARAIRSMNVADRDYFKDTVREQRPMIARVASSRVSGEPIVILTMPVFGSDGRVAARARRIAAPVEPIAARRPDAGRDDRRSPSRPSSSTPKARSCRIRRANGCCATAPPSRDRRRPAGVAPARQPDRARGLRAARRRLRGRHGRRSRRRLDGPAHRARRRPARRRDRRARSARAGSRSASPSAAAC